MVRLLFLAGAWAGLLGCSPGPGPGGDDGGADAGAHEASAALRACAGQAGAVTTVSQVVARLNALPRPVGVACFVASLARPLALVGTTSTFSAQPAASAKSPRLFVVSSSLILSVVPEGIGANLLELGEFVTSTRTLKGELELPVTASLATDAPLTRVEQSNGTTSCGICHRNEAAYPTVAHGYASVAFRPNPGLEVRLPALEAEHRRCTDTADASARCELYHALFDFGPVRQGAFSTALEVFF